MFDPVHVLSRKSTRQRRNVFIWCTQSHSLALGWRVDNDSPITVSTAYRWITDAVLSQARHHTWKEAERYTLFPVEVRPSMVMTYSVHQNGPGLSRESQDIIVPGDYGLYTIVLPFSTMEEVMEENSPVLSAKVPHCRRMCFILCDTEQASLTPPIVQRALDRDCQCIFSGVVPSCDSDALVATWVFPPFMGYKLSDDPWLEGKYYRDPDACDLSELTVVENVISGHKDIVTLFRENKLGVDVEDNYRIIVFEGSESLKDGAPLKSHLDLIEGPCRPSDRFLRLHFNECLAVSVCLGDALEDYGEHEIENFMEELGVYDGEIAADDPRWSTLLGQHVHAYFIRQKMAEHDLMTDI